MAVASELVVRDGVGVGEGGGTGVGRLEKRGRGRGYGRGKQRERKRHSVAQERTDQGAGLSTGCGSP